MENIHEMRNRHDNEIKELQKLCPHEKFKWMPNMWAPGHFDGEVRVCDFCGKILENKNMMKGFKDE